MRRFALGDFVPKFVADSTVNPTFSFDTLGGKRVLLMFIGSAGTDLGRSVADALVQSAASLKSKRILVYLVTTDRRDREEGRLAKLTKHFTVFWDFDRKIHRLYGMELPPKEEGEPAALRVGGFLIRENLRLQSYLPATPLDTIGSRLETTAGSLTPLPEPHVVTAQAPVLIIPDVVDRAFCRRLIDFYEGNGGSDSGFMRDIGGRTHGILDPKMKRRKDCYISDVDLQRPIRHAIATRVAPEISKAFGASVNRVERYLIGCYDDTDRGFFSAHRDNVSKATAHRQFAMSLNLNSEEYDGGTLRFPEYGSHLYKPETGCAVIFSCSLLHEAMPVTRGRRYVLLPFLYDDAHAQIRADNLQYLEAGDPKPISELSAA